MPIKVHPTPEGILSWSIYSAAHKVDLTGTVLRLNERAYVFDPPSAPSELPRRALEGEKVVVLTNENHLRSAKAWRDAGAVVYGTRELKAMEAWMETIPEIDGAWMDFQIRRLNGGPIGERAFLCRELRSAVFGDAVVHLPERGLEMLPAKYCRDQRQLRRDVRGLRDWTYDLALFAHGVPLVENPAEAVFEMAGRGEL